MSTTKDTSRHQLIYNAVQCGACGKIVESTYGHDYNTCGCVNQAMADGGLNYARYGGKYMELVHPLHRYFEDTPFTMARKLAFRLHRTKGAVKIKDMSDAWLNAAIEDQIDRDYGADWHMLLLLQEALYRRELVDEPNEYIVYED